MCKLYDNACLDMARLLQADGKHRVDRETFMTVSRAGGPPAASGNSTHAVDAENTDVMSSHDPGPFETLKAIIERDSRPADETDIALLAQLR